MKIRLHEPTFGEEEIAAAVDVLRSTQVTHGAKVKEFERQFAAGAHGIAVNSGSSANLLLVSALTNPATAGRLHPGDEVIVSALSWSTTVWPLVQHGLTPVIVDVDPGTFNISPEQVERAISLRTRGLMPVHVYGNPCDMDALEVFASDHIELIEDCCEALGATYAGQPVGTFGRGGTFSFYYSHHMTTIEGGMVLTHSTRLADRMRILRAHGWIRDVERPQDYVQEGIDPRFTFVDMGYNLRMNEVQAAIGLAQLPKLPGFVETRRANAHAWTADLSKWGDFFSFQEETVGGRSSWFGFSIVLKPAARFSVAEIRDYLGRAGIETRPIICGNIARQPGMQLYPHRVVGDLRHANNIMDRAFSFGNHQAIGPAERGYVTGVIDDFMRARA